MGMCEGACAAEELGTGVFFALYAYYALWCRANRRRGNDLNVGFASGNRWQDRKYSACSTSHRALTDISPGRGRASV